MKEKDKKLIVLTIKDLRDLGVIGKKKRKKRRYKRLLKSSVIQQQQNTLGNSTTSSSDNNLKNEVEKIQNQVYNNGIINNNNTIKDRQILTDLQNQHTYLQDATINGFQHFNNKTRFLNDKPEDNYHNPRLQAVRQNIFYDTQDGIDNPTTEGSDSFIDNGEPKPEYNDPTQDNDFSSQSDYNPSTIANSDYFQTFKTPTLKNINTSDFETDTKNIINNPQVFLNQEDSDLIGIKPNRGDKNKATRLDLEHQAQNLGITEPLTSNIVALRVIIADKKRLIKLIEAYEELGGKDEKFLTSKSSSEVRAENTRLAIERKKSLNKFTKK